MKKVCNSCILKSESTNCISGWGNPEAKLVILLESPGDTLMEKLVVWMCYKLSLTAADIWVDYVFKCPLYKEKKANLKPCFDTCWSLHARPSFSGKQLIIASNWGADFLVNAKMKEWHGRYHAESDTWICYSFKYLLMNPAECVNTSRIMYKAAEKAGLKPEMNLTLEAFEFPTRKL